MFRRVRGFTLVEMVLTIVIIAIAVAAITGTLAFAFRFQGEGIWRAKAMALADSYLEQILSRRFDETTPPGGNPPCTPATCTGAGAFDDGEARALFDDVDDYDGIDDLPPVDESGAALAGFDGYRVQVAVAYADAGQITAFGLADATDLKVVTLTVTPPGKPAMQFRALKANF